MTDWVYRRPSDPRQAQRLARVPLFYSENFGDMAGATTLTFAQTATLSALSSTSGATTLTFSETAALDYVPNFGDMAGITSISFTAILDSAQPQPELSVRVPKFRSVDGKTLADHFNRGLPQTPDYEWGNRRRFYQDGA